jgi:hypothetical protein
MTNNIAIILIITAAIALIIFLTSKNIKDKKSIHPDAQDIMDEIIRDKERDREKT